MYTLKRTQKVNGYRNLCDHIWVEDIFLTKVGVAIRLFFARIEKEQCILNGATSEVVGNTTHLPTYFGNNAQPRPR